MCSVALHSLLLFSPHLHVFSSIPLCCLFCSSHANSSHAVARQGTGANIEGGSLYDHMRIFLMHTPPPWTYALAITVTLERETRKVEITRRSARKLERGEVGRACGVVWCDGVIYLHSGYRRGGFVQMLR